MRGVDDSPYHRYGESAKRSENFENYVFFDIEAMRTRSIVGKFISKRSEHVYTKDFKNRSEANTFDSWKIYFEAKQTRSIVLKSISKRSEHVILKNLKSKRSEGS